MIPGFNTYASADDFPDRNSSLQAKDFSLFKTNIIKY